MYSAYTDATRRNLYDYVTIPIFLLGTAYSIYTGVWINHLLTALVVFVVFYFCALKGGFAGGDVKFCTALAVWFGYPSTLYFIGLASITAAIYGSCKLSKMGLFKQRIVVYFRGVYMKIAYGIKGAIPENKLPENDEICEEAIPFGPFMVFAAWLVYLTPMI
nr:A24 family peptidase [Syntrophomonas palmitatica]